VSLSRGGPGGTEYCERLHVHEDVLADPTLLEHIPDDAEVVAIPIEEREPGRRYDLEMPRTVATVTAPTPER
jgi:hypothetical protein